MTLPNQPQPSINIDGNVDGANVVIGGTQSVHGDLSVSVGSMPTASDHDRRTLEEQIARLTELLASVPQEHVADVRAVKLATEDAIGEVAREEPDANRVQLRIDGLKRAAAAFTSIVPGVAEVASQIAATIATIGGLV